MGPQGTKVGSAYIDVTANTDKFRRGMAEMDAHAKRGTAGVRSEIEKTDARIKGMTGSIGMASTALAAFGGIAALGSLVKVADTFTQMRGRLSLVVKEGENLLNVEEKLYQLAIKNRAALEPTVALYARLRAARSDLSDAQALKIVDTWNKTLVISGASAGGAAAATIQLSQAMAGGVLRAEEFNSIVENNVRAVQLFASSLGVTMGELRTLVNEGKVGFDQLVKAMTDDAASVGDEFGKMGMTVGQALTNLQTAMIRFVGLQDQQFNGSKQLAEWIGILADNFDILATAILAAGASVASALGTGLLFSLVGSITTLAKQLLAAGSAAKAFGMAMTWLGGPWGVALGAAVAALGAVVVSLRDVRSEAEKAEDHISEANEALARTDEIVRQWELDQAAADIDAVATSSEDAAASIDAMNEAMTRSNRQMLIDIQTLKARQLQLDIIKAQEELAAGSKTIDFIDPYGTNPIGGLTTKTPYELEAIRQRIDALKKAQADALSRADTLGQIPVGRFGGDKVTPRAAAAPSGPTGSRTITELAGDYTALENYERNLADIRKASAEGAEGGNRAVLRAMREYLEAGGNVRRVLTDVKELSGSMLDPATLAMIDDLIMATQTMETINVPSEIEPPGVPNETAWQYYEQRVAEATKFGLLSAIETGEWGDAFGQILTDVTREALSNALDVLWEALAQIDWGGEGQGLGGFLNMVGSSFAGSRASGGDVTAGRKYRVGELGSVWFIPKTDGYIVPNGATGKTLGAPMQINVEGAQVIIQGDASERTAAMIAESLAAYTRALPGMIDGRVRDRQLRGDY